MKRSWSPKWLVVGSVIKASPDVLQTTSIGKQTIMRIVSLSVVVVTACGPSGTSTSSTTAPESELKILMLATAVESADTALIADLFWPEATYDDFANQLTYQGISEIVGYLTNAHEWGDDIYMNMGRINTGPTMAVGEWVFSAVQNRPMGDQVPFVTGREVVFNGATIIELEGGRIMRAADYIDTAPLTLQLGGIINFPTDGVTEPENIRR